MQAAAASPPPVLLPYQQAWIADTSQLKVGEKSRRIGLTWAEAADDVLIAAADRTAGGQNVYYIGYNFDMAIEYIEACAGWAKAFNRAAAEMEEGLWDDAHDEKQIKTYTIRFPESGFRIVALSSRPANLRGKQGTVVIDEAAFHDQLDELLKAALALLIWGGRVRVISTHNGDTNPFNELIQAIRAGKRAGSVVRTTFDEAVAQGLYRRVCLRLGKPWSAEGERAWCAEVRSFYGEAAEEELDVIPSQGTGAWLSTALIEARMLATAPVIRWEAPKGFDLVPVRERREIVQTWLDEEVLPFIREVYDAQPMASTGLGVDFGRRGDLTVLAPWYRDEFLNRHFIPLIELRRMPYDQQQQVLKAVGRAIRMRCAALDARGIGSQMSEWMADEFGHHLVQQVMLSETWYREQMPRVKAEFEDDTLTIPRHRDVLEDLRAVRLVRGVPRVPDERSTGSDGGKRHGDAAIAIALGVYAGQFESCPIEFESAGPAGSALPRAERGDHGFGSIGARHNLRGYQ